ncbi:MAG: rRNA maturation RNase YbeY [Syntrophobacteraceae bacterium]|jgi:probable rRNA maturation factor|nr:rRNA maturation RNase YbeY [Syntrophobacteraceae bacterium]
MDPVPIEKAAAKILSVLGYTDSELSILVVDDEEMRRINREYRDVDASTDVLSFPMHEGEFGDVAPELLGDVVISAPMAAFMAGEHGCPLSSVLDLLLVHGVLHLGGYDHERSPGEATRMLNKTVELLAELGHPAESFSWYFQDAD